MGMFDTVNYECVCPLCHNKVTNFQSKNGPCEMLVLEPREVKNFYASCMCGAWIEFDVIPIKIKMRKPVKRVYDK